MSLYTLSGSYLYCRVVDTHGEYIGEHCMTLWFSATSKFITYFFIRQRTLPQMREPHCSDREGSGFI